MNKIMGIINLYEKNEDLQALTERRTVGALPYAGRYRLIDFQLSNMVNNGIYNVGIFANNNIKSLLTHLGVGEAWNLNKKRDGLSIFYPTNDTSNVIHNRQMDVFRENLDYFENSSQEYVVVAPSNMIFSGNFKEVVEYHKSHSGDVTVLYKNVDDGRNNFLKCNTFEIYQSNRIVSVKKNGGGQNNVKVSMETFLMRKDFFINLIKQSSIIGPVFSLPDLINHLCNQNRVFGYEHKGHVQCINSINSYYKNSMEILKPKIFNELLEKNVIYTKTKDNAPAKYGKDAVVKNSYIANGAIIEGTVENSIVFRGVKVEKGAIVKNSILITKSIIGEGVKVNCVITDKRAKVDNIKNINGEIENPTIIPENCVV